MPNKKEHGKIKKMLFVIILTIIVLIVFWKIKCFFIQQTADAYLEKKYNVQMISTDMRFTIADPSGYFITYYPADNDNIKFTVSVYSSLYARGYIEDDYRLSWFRWELQELMNKEFSKNLEALGDKSRIQVVLKYYKNDEINENRSIFDGQKEIPYEIFIHTDCTDMDLIDALCNTINLQGYIPQKIKVRT